MRLRRSIIGIGAAVFAAACILTYMTQRSRSAPGPARTDTSGQHANISGQQLNRWGVHLDWPRPNTGRLGAEEAPTTSVRVVTTPPLDTKESYAELSAAAERDHGEAAFILFRLLRICRTLLADSSQPAVRVPPDFDGSWCEQVPEDADYLGWLRRSRDSGYLPATVMFSRLTPAERTSPNATEQELADEHARLATAMHAAAQAGSVQAMAWLGRDIGHSADDLVVNYAYSLAAAQQMQLAVDQGLTADREVDRLNHAIAFTTSQIGLNFTPDQLATAYSLKESLVAKTPCCVFVRLSQ